MVLDGRQSRFLHGIGWYRILNQAIEAHSIQEFDLIWSLKLPPSLVVYLWRLILDRLPTKSKLSRRGVVAGNLLCPLCLDGDET